MASPITRASVDVEAEEAVRASNPELWSILMKLLDSGATFPITDEEKERARRWNLNTVPSLWANVREELTVLGDESDRSREEEKLLTAITSNQGFSAIIHEEKVEVLRAFVERYPVLVWLLYKGNIARTNISRLLVAAGKIRVPGIEIRRVTLAMIEALRDAATAEELHEMFNERPIRATLRPFTRAPASMNQYGYAWWWLTGEEAKLPAFPQWVLQYVTSNPNHASVVWEALTRAIVTPSSNVPKIRTYYGKITSPLSEAIFALVRWDPAIMKKVLNDKRFYPGLLTAWEIFAGVLIDDRRLVDRDVDSLRLILEDKRMNLVPFAQDLYDIALMYSEAVMEVLLSDPRLDPRILGIRIPDFSDVGVLERLLSVPGYISTLFSDDIQKLYYRNIADVERIYPLLYAHSKPHYTILVQLLKNQYRSRRQMNSWRAIKYIVEHGFEGTPDNRVLLGTTSGTMFKTLLNHGVFDASLAGQNELYENLSEEKRRTIIKNKTFTAAIGKEGVAAWKTKLSAQK